MRKAVTLGLLAAAFVPLALDHQVHGEAATRDASPVLVEMNEISTQIMSIMLATRNDDAIRLALDGSADARERVAINATGTDRTATGSQLIETASIRAKTAGEATPESADIEALNRELSDSLARSKAHREGDFTAARNAEIRRSLAAYHGARESLLTEARNREIAESSARAARQRHIAFAEARNAEARRSLAAYERARDLMIAEAYRRELALMTARYAELELSIARANNESLLGTLARLAPHIEATSTIETATLRANPIETSSISESVIIGPCTVASP